MSDTTTEQIEQFHDNDLKAILFKNIKLRDTLVNTILTRSSNNPGNEDINCIVKLLDSNDKVSLTQLKIKSDERQNKLGRESAIMVANALKQLDMRDINTVRQELPLLPSEIEINNKVLDEDFIGVKTFTYDEIMNKE